MDEFKREQGMDLRNDMLALQRLKEAAEKAKIELFCPTDRRQPAVHHGRSDWSKHMNIKVTRSKLESLVEDMVKASLDPVRTALKDSACRYPEIDDVILVGGQTRMPMVQKAVTDFFGKERGRREPG